MLGVWLGVGSGTESRSASSVGSVGAGAEPDGDEHREQHRADPEDQAATDGRDVRRCARCAGSARATRRGLRAAPGWRRRPVAAATATAAGRQRRRRRPRPGRAAPGRRPHRRRSGPREPWLIARRTIRGEVGRHGARQLGHGLAHVGERGGDGLSRRRRACARRGTRRPPTAEGVDVGGGGGGAALGLLGRDVGGRAHHLAGLGERHSLGGPGDAEVGHLDPPVGRDDQVGRLDVAVDDAARVGDTEGIGGLGHQVADDLRVERGAGPQQVGQRLALDELHHEVGARRRRPVDRAWPRRSRRPTRCRGGGGRRRGGPRSRSGCRKSASSANSGLSTLTATARSRTVSRARHTSPMPPVAMRDSRR